MNQDIARLVRPNILSLAPYTCARDEYSGEARAWLDANENSLLSGLNRYPDPLQRDVKERLGAIKGVGPERIFLGVGSDECIDLMYRVFCRPGVDNVVAIDPTYGMYRVAADINDVAYRPVNLGADYALDVDALLAATDANTKVIWICSPNNPTANAFPLDLLRSVAERFQGMTVVDEAYVDFSPLGSMASQVGEELPRLVVMQTFSKAWGAAAMRLGIAYAHPDVVGLFNKVKYPYNINILTQREALSRLSRRDEVARSVGQLLDLRNELARELAAIKGVKRVYPSHANFLLVEVDDADALYVALIESGVVVRNRSRVNLCSECLRITVGNCEENELLIRQINEFYETRAIR